MEINLNNARIENGILILESGEEITDVDIGILMNMKKIYGNMLYNSKNQKKIEEASKKGMKKKNILSCLKLIKEK